MTWRLRREAATFDLVIRGGTLITPVGQRQADLAVSDGRIAGIGKNLKGNLVIPAEGLLVLPGGIDPHVHLEMPVGVTRSSDDWFSGTMAAACGGTTTIIDFVESQPGESLADALKKRRALAQDQAAIDYGLHMTITNDDPGTLKEIASICQAGCPSFKAYMTYDGFRLSDAALLKVLTTVKAAGGIVLVHAENDALIQSLQAQFRQRGWTAPKYHSLSRPPDAEGEAIGRALALAEAAGAAIYIVHTSTTLGVQAIQAARRRGVHAFGETCPQYLTLSDQELSRDDFEGAKYVCSPPLRSHADQEALWQALASGSLQTIGTDHCPFNYATQKILGFSCYEKIPGGLPGIEARLALLYTFGVNCGKFSLERLVEVCSTNPARIFGLYPRKGSLQVGADADIVLFDPGRSLTLTHAMLHEQVDYTPYEGLELSGYPVMTLLRGKVIVDNGQFTGQHGQGQYLSRSLMA